MLHNNDYTFPIVQALDANLVFQRLQSLSNEQKALAVGFILGLQTQQAQENEHNKKRQQ